MDYEKMYKELKEQHDTMVTTFKSFKETSQKEKEELETKYQTLETESKNKIDELQQANINLYLKIPQKPTETTPPPQENKITCDDIIKDLGGK